MSRRVRDPLARYNERIKLLAGFLNAVGLGLIGFAVLKPVTETNAPADLAAIAWGAVGLALHAAAHYVLGYMQKEVDE